MTVSDNQIITRCEALLEAEVDGEIVGLHVERATCYGFNDTATRVWQLLAQPRTKAELRNALLEEFEVDKQACEAQLDALLHELQREGLVEIEAATE